MKSGGLIFLCIINSTSPEVTCFQAKISSLSLLYQSVHSVEKCILHILALCLHSSGGAGLISNFLSQFILLTLEFYSKLLILASTNIRWKILGVKWSYLLPECKSVACCASSELQQWCGTVPGHLPDCPHYAGHGSARQCGGQYASHPQTQLVFSFSDTSMDLQYVRMSLW